VRSIPRFTAVVLLVNSLFEIGAGTLILVSPGSVFPAANPHAAAVARTLAGAAISAGVLSLAILLAWQPGRLVRAILWVLALFHLVLAMLHGLGWSHGFTVITAPLAHLVLAVLFVLAGLRTTAEP
jgi:hypothetical protein